jgi:hypothetical protein
MTTYMNLTELKQAVDSGAVTEPLMLDNDDTHVYQGDECVFRMDPDTLLEQALTLLGIAHEPV